MPPLAARLPGSRSSVTPISPLAPISTAEHVSPAAPMSWIAMTQPLAMISRHASSKSFSENRVADLHGRALLLCIRVEFGRTPWWRRECRSRPVFEPR